MTPAEVATAWPRTELLTRPEFGALEERIYERERALSPADYTALLSTTSAFRLLDPAVRNRVLQAIAEQVEPQVDLRVQTMLYLARRLPY